MKNTLVLARFQRCRAASPTGTWKGSLSVLVGMALAGCAPGVSYGNYLQMIDSVGWTGPDRVAFAYRTYSWSRLYEHDLSTGKTTLLIDQFPAYAFDSNGMDVIYGSRDKTFEFSLATRRTRELPNELKRGGVMFDNAGIVVLTWGYLKDVGEVRGQGALYRLDSMGIATEIGRLPQLRNSTTLSPNRELIATADSTARPPIAVVYRLDANASDIATTTGQPIGWQDNDTLIVNKQDPGAKDDAPGKLYRFHIPTGTVDFIAARPAQQAVPSPDGKLIAFKDSQQVFTIPANGSDVTVRVDVKDLPPGDRQII